MQTRPIESDNISLSKKTMENSLHRYLGGGSSLFRVENCFHWNNNSFMEENGHLSLKFPYTWREKRDYRCHYRRRITVCDKPINPDWTIVGLYRPKWTVVSRNLIRCVYTWWLNSTQFVCEYILFFVGSFFQIYLFKY